MGQDVLGFLAGMPEAMIEELYARWLGGEELAADWQRFLPPINWVWKLAELTLPAVITHPWPSNIPVCSR